MKCPHYREALAKRLMDMARDQRRLVDTAKFCQMMGDHTLVIQPYRLSECLGSRDIYRPSDPVSARMFTR